MTDWPTDADRIGHIKALVDNSPPMTAAQIAKLSALFHAEVETGP